MRRIVVTSASGVNGDGYGALLCFSAGGQLAGPFSDDRRITDPRGLSLSPAGDLVYVTSGDDRVLALGQDGTVVLDSGRTEGLDPGGRTFAPDGATARRCIRPHHPAATSVRGRHRHLPAPWFSAEEILSRCAACRGRAVLH